MTDHATESDGAGLGSVRSVERAIEALQAFTLERPSMTVAEIVRHVPLSRPTLYRLLRTLEGKGMVRSDGEPARYELGAGIARIAHVWLSRLDPARLATPVLAQLWDETNETVAFCLPQGDMRVCVASIQAASRSPTPAASAALTVSPPRPAAAPCSPSCRQRRSKRSYAVAPTGPSCARHWRRCVVVASR